LCEMLWRHSSTTFILHKMTGRKMTETSWLETWCWYVLFTVLVVKCCQGLRSIRSEPTFLVNHRVEQQQIARGQAWLMEVQLGVGSWSAARASKYIWGFP
jgi:hypothetical protein